MARSKSSSCANHLSCPASRQNDTISAGAAPIVIAVAHPQEPGVATLMAGFETNKTRRIRNKQRPDLNEAERLSDGRRFLLKATTGWSACMLNRDQLRRR